MSNNGKTMTRRGLLSILGTAGLGLAGAALLPGERAWSAPLSAAGESGRSISVKDFGARGDGDGRSPLTGTDDTASIQLAIDSAGASGAAVFFPAGNYRVTRPLYLKDNMTLEGSGSALIYGAVTPNMVQTVAGNDFITIRGLAFHNMYTASGVTCLSLSDGARNILVEQCSFYGARSVGIKINAPGIRHITVTQCYASGTNFLSADLHAKDLTGCIFTNNIVEEGTGGIGINSPIRTMGVNRERYDSASQILISGNVIRLVQRKFSPNLAFCVDVAGGHQISISGNMLVPAADGHAIHLEDYASDISISGNIVQLRPGSSAVAIAVYESDSVHISGNTLVGIRETPCIGIQTVKVKEHILTTRLSILNNEIRDFGDDGIQLMGSEHVSIVSNVISGCRNGIRNVSKAYQVSITGNTISGCTGSAVNVQSFLGGYRIQDNVLTGNQQDFTANPAVLLTATGSMGSTRRQAVVSESQSAAFTLPLRPYSRLQGTITLSCFNQSNANISNLAAELMYDGKTAAITVLKSARTGNIGEIALSYDAAAGALQAVVPHPGQAGLTAELFMNYTGDMIL